MSFKRLTPSDFLVGIDTISATVWSAASPTLTTYFTSSTQEASSAGNFYLNIYQTGSSLSEAAIQFAIAYGHSEGSGSPLYNSSVNGKSYTSTIWGQYQNLVLGDENSNFNFGGVTSSDFWAISIDRTRYKEKLFLGSLQLKLSGSGGVLSLTDNSNATTTITYNEAGRVFQIVSGSQGVIYTGSNANGYSTSKGSYGLFLPDIGTLLLNPLALSESIAIIPSASSNTLGYNNRKLYQAISGSTAATFKLNSEETITSNYAFIRAQNFEFNYSENPSFVSGSTGEILYDLFTYNPQTYVTTIGLYNDQNELLAVAKMSRPLLKDFTKEALIRIKLDY